ncbi:hypothetical protein SARC_10805, partial [Sphaeroforma arctica JP610]
PRRALGDLGNKQGPGGSTVKRGFGKDLTNQSSQANNGSVKKRTGDSTKENHGSIRKHSEGARKKGLTTSRASKTILSLSPSKGVKHLKKDTQSTKAPKLSTMTPQAVVEDKQLGNSWEIEYAPKPEADVDDPITSDHGQYMEALIKPFKRTLSPPGPSPRASLTAPMRTVCRDDLSSDDDAPSAYGHFATSIGTLPRTTAETLPLARLHSAYGPPLYLGAIGLIMWNCFTCGIATHGGVVATHGNKGKRQYAPSTLAVEMTIPNALFLRQNQ